MPDAELSVLILSISDLSLVVLISLPAAIDWVWDATRRRRRRDMTLMQVCREVGSLELVRIERSINFVATDKDQKSTPCPV